MALSNQTPHGFVQGQTGWTLKGGATFLGPRGSGSFPTLCEAVVWANLLGGQCGGIKHDPKYGYMLVHGHEFVDAQLGGTVSVPVGMCWSKGKDHVPEPRYPYMERGYAKFLTEVVKEEVNGRVFSAEFKAKYVKPGWHKITRADFNGKIEDVYAKASKPGWIRWAASNGIKLGSVCASAIGGMVKTTSLGVYNMITATEPTEELGEGWVEVPEHVETCQALQRHTRGDDAELTDEADAEIGNGRAAGFASAMRAATK